MTLLDRFRTQARDKHQDPAVRLAFVEELPLAERETIATIAREDEDPRVRKAAVAKLMAPAALAAIARDDKDDQVRAQASSMLRDIALESFEELGEADSLDAVDLTVDARALAHLAKTAVRDSVALRAVARVDDGHLLGSVARQAVAEPARRRAFEALEARGERAELLGVALNGDFKDTAVAAVEQLHERTDLDHIVARGRNKSAVKRARAIIREADERAARAAAAAAVAAAMAAIDAEPAIIEPIDDLASPPHGDPLASAIAGSQPSAAEVAVDTAPAASIDADTEAAAAAAQAAAEADTARRLARLGELATEATSAVEESDFPAARRRFQPIRREWRTLATDLAADHELATTFATADARMTTREQDAQEADAKSRRDALARVQQLIAKVELLAGKDDLTLKAAERAIRDIRELQSSMPSLPSKQDFEDVTGRIKAMLHALTPKAAELREAQDWKRFANVTIQEQLCVRMEALRTVDDLEVAARQVRELQQQWRAAADVPRAQADALWRRFKAAHDEVWARCEAFFAVQSEQRVDNLAKKVALCERAEALSDSTQWIQTADEIKKLQNEWKTIGPVSRGKEKAIWDRFRTACDRFFTRRHDDLAVRKASWTENLTRKEALCVRAEALAQSTEWDQAATEIKKLQAEWKTIGPVKKTRSEAIWQRFRGACDSFFARYAQRHDTARAERVAAREALCVELEGLLVSEDPPADLLARVRTLRGHWLTEVNGRGVEPEAARQFDQRFTTALNALVARFPQPFANTDLDPEASRKKMEAIVAKVEALAKSLAAQGPTEAAASPTNRLAAMLKEALAANTIGGKGDDDAKFRAVTEDLRNAQASWARVGYVPDAVRRPLTDRFHRAVKAISERTAPRKPARA